MLSTTSKNTETALVISLLELGSQLERAEQQHIQKSGITVQQWLFLLYIQKNPVIPYCSVMSENDHFLASELATLLNVSRPNVTNMINHLLNKGLVMQIGDKDDKRRKVLKISVKGRDLLYKIEKKLQVVSRAAFEGLNLEERTGLLAIIRNCLKKLHKI